jgi:hypothetical protein
LNFEASESQAASGTRGIFAGSNESNLRFLEPAWEEEREGEEEEEREPK